jgi:hypothetical protein
MVPEGKKIERLFNELLQLETQMFPKEREQLMAPSEPGVYVIRKNGTVLHCSPRWKNSPWKKRALSGGEMGQVFILDNGGQSRPGN